MAEPADIDSPSDADGVFGNLPAARPGARSPRREGAAKDAGNGSASKPRAAKPAPPPPKRTAPTPPPPPPPPADPPPEPATAPDPGEQIGGVEDLAWAGIAVAAQAATVGVKAASRAIDAVRKSIERP